MSPISAGVERQVVAVSPGAALAARPRLFAALELICPVRFRALSQAPDPAAVVRLPGADADDVAPAARPRPTIVFGEAVHRGLRPGEIRLLRRESVDRRLRGIMLLGQLPSPRLQPSGDEEVLATDGSGPRWTVARATPHHHRVAAELPELGPKGNLRSALTSEHSTAIVALTQFLRAVCAESDFAPPPLRAAIIFDDPNVRRRSYGYIDFRRLVEHADRHRYHAAMAMVPLDAGSASRATASLFKQRADRLSLTFHGNSHLKNELADVRDLQSALSLGAQARRRVASFELRTGLRVDRVMVPPHGMCSESAAAGLAAVGFDALCAIHPRPWSEEMPHDLILAGWEPATFAGPSAVIPRFPLQSTSTDIALRAFTDTPIILYGHHQDVASGLDLLEQAAGRVNALGEVRWVSVGDIAASNFARHTSAETMRLRAYAGRVRVRLPAGVRELVVEEPAGANGTLRGWSVADSTTSDFGAGVPVEDARELEIRLRTRREVDPRHVPVPRWQPWPRLRRTAAEVRDRAMPLAGAGRLDMHTT